MTGPVTDALVTMLGMAAGGAAFVGLAAGGLYLLSRRGFADAIYRWSRLLLVLFAGGLALSLGLIALAVHFDRIAALGHTPLYPLAGGSAAALAIVLAFIVREKRRGP